MKSMNEAYRPMAICFVAFMWFAVAAHAARNSGIVVESVDDYTVRNGPSLNNSIANGDGFLNNMVFPGSDWQSKARWTDGNVWDTDFFDPSLSAAGDSLSNFDQPGTGISYFTGHGFCHTPPMDDGCSTQQSCTTTAACQTPNTARGERMPASCRISPLDAPRCCYMMDRGAATSGNRDKNSGVVDYTSGPVRFGKGGTHMAVLDISCGTLQPFWYLALKNAVSGAHLVATILVLGGDTNNIPDRGRTFAMFYQATAIQSVAEDWAATVNWLPASEGRGINGYGCNIVLGIDNSAAAASAHLKENWIELQDSNLNSKGNSWYAARFICNYPLSNANEKTWELP